MLLELSIKNFAIIDDLKINFAEGLTILSGETGAGKSIIINAVNLLLGSRATAKLIRGGAANAELAALFQIDPDGPVAGVVAAHGYDPSEGLLIRRIIARNNRHRVYINGSPATIAILSAVAANLASISGQHAHQGLLDEEQQLLILDQYGDLLGLRRKVAEEHRGLLPLIDEHRRLLQQQQRQQEQIELLRFQKHELEAAAVQPDEDQTLEQERRRLKNAEQLYRTVYEGIEELYGAQQSVVERIGAVQSALERAVGIDPELGSAAEGIADVRFRVEDLVEALRRYLKDMEMDESRLEAVEARIDTLQRLKRKYGGSLQAVIERQASLAQELAVVENLHEKIAAMEAELGERHRALAADCTALHNCRMQVAETLAGRIEKELATLQMSRTRFEVALHTIAAEKDAPSFLCSDGLRLSATGTERVTFMLAPNVGEALKPLASIASGGELSRVILAIKAILASSEAVAMVVFDEVDAGIGGSVAEVIGQKLSALARRHQVICITHLPQIAKFGDHHYHISKHVTKGRTRTQIRILQAEERVEELARMLGGVEITQTTRDHARELIKRESGG